MTGSSQLLRAYASDSLTV